MSGVEAHQTHPQGADSTRALSQAFARQVEVIVTTAERAASDLAHEVETAATERAASILANAEREAERILTEAGKRSDDYLTASRRRIDEFAAERIRRLSELTDGLIEVAESIQQRHAQAEEINRRLYGLITAVGDAAETVTREAAGPIPDLPPSAHRYEDPPAQAPQRAVPPSPTDRQSDDEPLGDEPT